MLIRTTIDDDIPRALEAALVAARPRLLRLARLRGVPADVAEDVVQETLLEAWRCVDRVYDPTGIHRWLDEICRNICRRYARGHALEQRHAHLPIPAPDDDGDDATTALLNDIPDSDAADPIEELTRQDMALLLDHALGLLPGNAREVVELCYLRELPQREATDRLGLSLSALEARLHRARRQLRALFNGPLRGEAEAFGLALDDESAAGMARDAALVYALWPTPPRWHVSSSSPMAASICTCAVPIASSALASAISTAAACIAKA